ncbi:MAG: gliding motility-associated C-terminal domain-containing protein [Bacteroidales bacterium]|nr:gliding motility-associated C-terminal domain-containing protein [Bacteroidales bacterium]
MKRIMCVLMISFIFALSIYAQDGKLEFTSKNAFEDGYLITFVTDKISDENQPKLVLNDLLIKKGIYDVKYALTADENVEFQIYTDDKISAAEVREVLLKNGLDFNFSTVSVDGIITNKSTFGTSEDEFPVLRPAYSQDGYIDTTLTAMESIPDYRIYFPTAINLRSLGNDEFYPIGVGVDEEAYQMTIYSRWGEIIFTTKNWNTHWKGRYDFDKGDYVPQGVYNYVVTLRDINAKSHTHTGTVTVFK